MVAAVKAAAPLTTPTTDVKASATHVENEIRQYLGIGAKDLGVLLVESGENQYFPVGPAEKSGLYAAAKRLEEKGYITIVKTPGEREAYLTFLPTAAGMQVIDAVQAAQTKK
jgi:hypothetical protein